MSWHLGDRDVFDLNGELKNLRCCYELVYDTCWLLAWLGLRQGREEQ